MKKKLILLLTALILLSGCGSDPSAMQLAPAGDYAESSARAEAAISAFSATPEPAVYPLTEEEVTVSMMLPASDTAETEGMKLLIEALEQETGVNIQVQLLASDIYYTNLNQYMAAGDAPDLLLAVPDWMLSQGPDCVLVLDDLVREYAPNYLAAVKDCYDGERALISEEYGILQLYRFCESPRFVPKIGAVIRQDWLEELGFDLPETYEDYHELLLAMKNTYQPKLPFRLFPEGVTPGDNFTAGFGISLGSQSADSGFYQEDGVVKFGALQAGYEDYVTMMHQWYQEGIVTAAYQDTMDLYSNSYLIELSTGSSGVFFVPISSYALLEGMCDFPLTPGMDPVQEHGETTHIAPVCASQIYGAGFSIYAGCQEPELAMQVADWFYSDTAVLIGNYGQENVTYTVVDGQPTYTDLIFENSEQLSVSEALGYYTTNIQGVISDARLDGVLQEYAPLLDVWTRQKDTDNMLPTGVQMTQEESEEFGAIMADVNTYLDSTTAKMVSGDMPLSDMEKVRETLETLNLARATEILQTAYTRYLS
jgi:putative aldouronate transport system substrate-binding protein